MKKLYFHVCLDVTDKPCLVVGGNEEALEKAGRFVECGAKLTLVSPMLLPELEEFVKEKGIHHLARRFEPGDVKGMFFTVNSVKTDPPLSESIYRACLAEYCLISAYDQPQWSNITMPFLVRSGKLRVAVSTNATSPGMASKLGTEMSRAFDVEFAEFLDWVAAYREDLIKNGADADKRREVFRKILKDFRMDVSFTYPEFYDKVRRKNKES